jgi:hypothetical protein
MGNRIYMEHGGEGRRIGGVGEGRERSAIDTVTCHLSDLLQAPTVCSFSAACHSTAIYCDA